MEKKTSELIKDLRKSKRLTQAQLADLLNVSDKAVSKWENDEGMPDIENLKRLASVFNVSVDYILGNHVSDKKIIERDWIKIGLSIAIILLFFFPMVKINIFLYLNDFGFDILDSISSMDQFLSESYQIITGFSLVLSLFNPVGLMSIIVSLMLIIILAYSIFVIVSNFKIIDNKLQTRFGFITIISSVVFLVFILINYLVSMKSQKFVFTPYILTVLVIGLVVYNFKQAKLKQEI